MKLREIIGSTMATTPMKGMAAFDYVAEKISLSEPVTISFIDITDCTSAFCNSFVGKLYMKYDFNKLERLLSITDFENEIWEIKVKDAKLLGANENLRNVRKSSIENLVFC